MQGSEIDQWTRRCLSGFFSSSAARAATSSARANHVNETKQNAELWNTNMATNASFLARKMCNFRGKKNRKKAQFGEVFGRANRQWIFHSLDDCGASVIGCDSCSVGTVMLKAVILIGGPQKGTRFRPLSLDVPKPLFPVAGFPSIQHHIEACCKVPNLKEILLIGFYQYQSNDAISNFVSSMSQEYKISIRYLQEYASLGTAGGIYHFRDQIKSGNPDAFILMHGDVCGNFPLVEMTKFHQSRDQALVTIMVTEATRQQSLNYGCVVEDKESHEVMHYAEKPSTFVSTIINCGIYVCSLSVFQHIAMAFNRKQQEYYSSNMGDNGYGKDNLRLEQDILMPLIGTGSLFVFHSAAWWSQMKTAGSAIYANKHYLDLYHKQHPERLAENGSGKPRIKGDVFIHPTATIHPTAKLGPNVSIGKGVTIGPGVRIRESIILGNAMIQDHSCILYSIIGWNSVVGSWCRVEGTPCDPNPNKPFAKMENVPLFNSNGRLNPSITILGCNVHVPSEVIVLNSIVLPHKDLSQSYKNEIIL